MNRSLRAAFVSAGVVTHRSGSAATPTPVPVLKPDLTGMNFFIGTGSCHTRLRGSDRPNTTTYAMALDGRWVRWHDVAPPFDKYRTKTIVSDGYMTYTR